MHVTCRRPRGDQGAMMIQMAVASIAFIALASLAVDYGIKLIARTEAQRAADAGALAGAVNLAFDPDAALDDYANTRRSAKGYALANTVFGQQPDVHLTDDINIVECPPPNGGPGTICVRVNVYRNQERDNSLPTFFSRIVDVNEQGVKATATAKVLNGDTTDCLRPWAVIDRWDEVLGTEPDYPGTDPDFCTSGCPGGRGGGPSTYDKYSTGRGGRPPAEPDLYVPPATDGSSAGTGYRVPDDVGRRIALKVQANDSVSSGWGLALDLPRSDTTSMGASTYGDNILGCSGIDVTINDPAVAACPVDATDLGSWAEKVEWAGKGCVRVQTGTMAGPTSANVEALVARDDDAYWGTTDEGVPGVVDSAFPASPRIVPVAIADIDSYLAMNPSGSGGVVRIVNIFGFFIEGMGDYNDATGDMELKKGGKAVIGRLMKYAGSGSGRITLHNSAAYTKIIVLVR